MSLPCWRMVWLCLAAAVLVAPPNRRAMAAKVTVITPRQTVAVEEATVDADGLWVSPADLTRIHGLVLKPEGVCLDELCIPLSRKPEDAVSAVRDGRTLVNLTALARQLQQPVVVDADAGVWSLGAIPPLERARLDHATAPDFTLRDRQGKEVRLADFRGKKVLLLTWASWCQCKQDLVGWQKVYEELRDKNFEIVAAAQDSDGEAAAGPSYDRAKATFTTLIDPEHTVSSLYQMVNVPCGVWIDEQGTIVRPAEVAYSKDVALLSIKVGGDKYVAALRDWVTHGAQSAYAIPRNELRERLTPKSETAALADANFKLAVYFHQQQDQQRADKYFAAAQQLMPDDWNYHRQQWSFTPKTALTRWMEKYRALGDKEYYEPLKLDPAPK
ncbi:MAG: TlpA family protein disulfide reductase [Planctomycetaceae bacterium]|nr:TlpA family protein disulfide reductase [Planctomycetaceae bacterium]